MATTLEGNKINRLTISPTSDHTLESFGGNLEVTTLNSVLIHSHKKNVRVYGRNAQTGAWTVSAIIGPSADSEEGLGTKYYKKAAIETTNFDRISVVPIDAAASANIRVVHSRVLPSSSFTRGQGASNANEYELTSLAAGVAQTINNVTGMPIVQVFEQTTTAGSGNTELDVLRLHLDSDLTDSSTSGHTVTAVGDAAISTSEKKFGAGSIALDGNGDSLSVPHSADFNFGAGDFTIEMWVRFNTTAGTHGLISHGGWGLTSADYPGWILHWGQNWNGRTLKWNSGGGDHISASSWTPTSGSWYHLAVVRASGTTTLYVDGTSQASGVVGIQDTSHTLYIGRSGDGVSTNSNIDDVRITKGLARYTANFTVPAAAHPDANTGGTSTLTDKTHNYTVTHDSSTNQLSVTSASPVDTIKVRIATA